MQMQFVWYMNEEIRIKKYEVIVKNGTPYTQKHYCSWFEASFYNQS